MHFEDELALVSGGARFTPQPDPPGKVIADRPVSLGSRASRTYNKLPTP